MVFIFSSCLRRVSLLDAFFIHVSRFVEVEYDAARDEKEQHEAKMRDLEKVEKLRKEKEEASEDERTILLALLLSLDSRCPRTGEEQ